MDDLKPCPCGAGLPDWSELRYFLIVEQRFKLGCHSCGKKTRSYLTKRGAVEEWNTCASEARDE